MRSRDIRSADYAVLSAFWILAVIGLLWTVINFLVKFEDQIFPVISRMEVTHIEQHERTIRLSGTMQVNRACRLEEVLLYTGDGREPAADRERLRLRVIREPIDLAAGNSSWGPWEIARPSLIMGPHLVARMTHRCHPLFDTTGVVLLLDATSLFEAADQP